MLKKTLLVISVVIVIFLVFFIFNISLRDLTNIPSFMVRHYSTVVKQYQKKSISIKLKNERVKLVAAYGGQEKVDELLKTNSYFCLDDTDCLLEESSCRGERQPINIYHYKPYSGPQSDCFGLIDIDGVTCQNNQCRGVTCQNNECRIVL